MVFAILMKIIGEKHRNSFFRNVANLCRSTVCFWCQGIAQKIIFFCQNLEYILIKTYVISYKSNSLSFSRLLTASQKLGAASTAADDSQRMCKVLENKSLSDEARMESLENQLKDARILAEEADKNYDEIASKLQMVEGDLERAKERAETGESKIIE